MNKFISLLLILLETTIVKSNIFCDIEIVNNDIIFIETFPNRNSIYYFKNSTFEHPIICCNFYNCEINFVYKNVDSSKCVIGTTKSNSYISLMNKGYNEESMSDIFLNNEKYSKLFLERFTNVTSNSIFKTSEYIQKNESVYKICDNTKRRMHKLLKREGSIELLNDYGQQIVQDSSLMLNNVADSNFDERILIEENLNIKLYKDKKYSFKSFEEKYEVVMIESDKDCSTL